MEVTEEKKVNNNERNNFKPRRKNNRRPRQFEKKEFEEKVVSVGRITKVVKGGRRFRFNALVVIGDKKGRVGMGTGKANEVPDAIKKAIEDAKKNLITVSLRGSTIPHEVNGKHSASNIFMKPASKGTGVVAGGPVRSVLELAGIHDILSKSYGSRTSINMVRATIKGLSQLKTREQIAKLREE